MSELEKVIPGPITGDPKPKEAVCINTNKIYDSCKDKECLEDLRVFLTKCSQAIVFLEWEISLYFTGFLEVLQNSILI